MKLDSESSPDTDKGTSESECPKQALQTWPAFFPCLHFFGPSDPENLNTLRSSCIRMVDSSLSDRIYLPIPDGVKLISWAEIARHRSRESCWIVIDGSVYDITNWLSKHPGGDVVLLNAAGVDCTDMFNAYHPLFVGERMLKLYMIGKVEDYSVSKMVKEYRVLARSIESSSLMQTNTSYYVRLCPWYATLLVGVVVCVVGGSSNLWISSVLGGILMAGFFQQVAFLGHDLGHTAVTHTREGDTLLGLLCGNMMTGISMGWWKATHNTHHISTNHIPADPDIQHFPFFAVSPAHSKGYFSTYHERTFSFDLLSRVLVPLQDKLYYLIMGLARCNLYIQSYVFLLSSDRFRRGRVQSNRCVELLGLFFFATWFTFLVSLIPTTAGRILFTAISHFLAGILHVQITLSHFSMAVYSDQPWTMDSFMEHQMKTSMDIDCSEWLDWFHGGLQFQVSHHLFPRIPRHNLRKLRMVVMQFAKAYQLPYQCIGFVAANKLMIQHLGSVSKLLRSQMLDDIVNLRG